MKVFFTKWHFFVLLEELLVLEVGVFNFGESVHLCKVAVSETSHFKSL